MNRDLRIISFSLFTWALGEGLFANIVTLYLQELGGRPEQIGITLALSSLVQGLAMLPAGWATDRWGGRGVLIGGWVIGLVAAVMLALATNLWLFAAAWVLYGATAWVVPPMTSYIANGRGHLSPERAFTSVFVYFSAGFIISPAIGGMVGKLYGLRAPFVLATLFFTISTILMCLIQPQARAVPPAEHKPGKLFRNRQFIGLMFLMFLVAAPLGIGVPFAPNFLQDHWAIDVAKVGLLGSVASLGEVGQAMVLGRKSPRWALMALQTAALVYLLIVLNLGQIGWLAVGFFLRGGVLMARQFVDAISSRVISPSQQGMAFATSATVQRIAGVAAAGAAGWLYAVRPALPFQASLLLIPLSLSATWLLIPRILRAAGSPAVQQESILSD